MTPAPLLPFIALLKKDADGFANALGVVALICVAYFLGRAAGSWFDWWSPVQPATAHVIGLFLLFWMICKAVWATIDYTIFAVSGALTDMAAALVNGVTESAAETPAAAPLQRESAVEYLHDYLRKRNPRQVTADGAAPADPSSPDAA